jgi:hypothetical protein
MSHLLKLKSSCPQRFTSWIYATERMLFHDLVSARKEASIFKWGRMFPWLVHVSLWSWVLLGRHWKINWCNRYSCTVQVISGYMVIINVMYHAIMSLLLFRVTQKCSLTVRFDVLMMVGMFWDVTQCNLVDRYWHFTGTYCFRLQSRENW